MNLITASLISALCIAGMAYFDPKRERRLRGTRSVRWLRFCLLILLLLPGVFLFWQGQTSVWVVWLGFVCVAGWVAANLLNSR